MTKHTSLGTEEDFFRKLREGSRVKQKIVSEYFVYYSSLMSRHRDKVGYADLFAGPGWYSDKQGLLHKSTPALVCEAAIRDPALRLKTHLWFNEGDGEHYVALKSGLQSLAGYDTLRYTPEIWNRNVNMRWAETMKKVSVPMLVFLDPCGYKGLSLRLVASVLGGFGNDCIFFFNYSRINMKLDLEVMNNSIDEFFEADRAKALRAAIQGRTPDERESIILDAVKSAIKAAHGIPLFFRFLSDRNRTSHHLVFASKNRAAVNQMKRILNAASSTVVEGVGSGSHDPRATDKTGSLFDGLFEVEDHLLATYGGQRIRFDKLISEESETRFTEGSFRDALLRLEGEGRVIIDPPAQSRRYQPGRKKRTLPKEAHIEFRGLISDGD